MSFSTNDFYNPDEMPSEEEIQAQKTANAWKTAGDVGAGIGGIGGTALGLIPGLEPFAPVLGAAGGLAGKGVVAGAQALFDHGPNAEDLKAERERRLAEWEAGVAKKESDQRALERALALVSASA